MGMKEWGAVPRTYGVEFARAPTLASSKKTEGPVMEMAPEEAFWAARRGNNPPDSKNFGRL